jgi:Ca2+-binding EF-hand superfamily protein
MRSLLTAMLGLTVGLGVLSLSHAQDQKNDKDAPDVEAQFKKIDKNGDQKLSMEEFVDGRPSDQTEQQATASFAKADKNKDNSLTLAEYKTTIAKNPEKKKEPA